MAMTATQRMARWAARHPRGVRFTRIKANAKRAQREFSLAFEDIIWPTHCPVLGIELDYSTGNGKGKSNDAKPSFDRLYNDLGYVPGNVNIISDKANRMKSNATLKEIKQLVTWLEQQEKNHD